MNNLLKFSLLISFVFYACNEEQEKEETNHKDQTENSILTGNTGDTCTDSGYQIYKEAVLMWESSWSSVHNAGGSNFETLNFSSDSILKLKSMVNDSEGIRAYYALISHPRIPSLVLVNIIGCEDQYDPTSSGDVYTVLISDPVLGEYFAEPSEEVAGFINKWKTFVDNLDLSVHSPVYAYNYGWDELSKTIDILKNQQISVSYGLRTLSADEYYEFHDVDPPVDKDGEDPELMGSIVYCNILYGDDPEQEYFNFAKPCPRYCDPLTALIINEAGN